MTVSARWWHKYSGGFSLALVLGLYLASQGLVEQLGPGRPGWEPAAGQISDYWLAPSASPAARPWPPRSR